MTGILCRLFRLRLVLANSVSAAGGFLLFDKESPGIALAAAMTGVFMLVSGASALNQVLERDLDRLMARTAKRPLPQGELTPAAATVIGGFCSACGFLILLYAGGMLPAILGAAALLWYLAIYTPLKRRTSLALPVGALCGAVPPLIGWCAAGGGVGDFRIILVVMLWYLWQVPHFWLLQGRHRADYRNASLPLFDPASGPVHSLVHCTWTVALLTLLLLFPVLGLMPRLAAGGCALLCCLVLAERSGAERALAVSSFNVLPLFFSVALYLER